MYIIDLTSSVSSSSLVKMLYWMCEKSGLPPTWPQLKHAICRNFGGMESDELDTLEEFKQQIHVRQTPDLQSVPEKVCINLAYTFNVLTTLQSILLLHEHVIECGYCCLQLHSIVDPDCSRLGLIKTSLMTKETSWHGYMVLELFSGLMMCPSYHSRHAIFFSFHPFNRENRYLLFLTENYAALEILRHYLNDVVHSSSLATATPGDCESSERLLEKMEPFILFGSSFPRDKDYTQVCM